MMINRNLMNKYGVMMIPDGIKNNSKSIVDNSVFEKIDDFIIRMFKGYNVVIKNAELLKTIKEENLDVYLEMFEKSVKMNYGHHKSNVIFKIGEDGDVIRGAYAIPQILSAINYLTGYVWTKYENTQGEIPNDEFINGVMTITMKTQFEVMGILMKDICGPISIKPDDFDWMKHVIHPGIMMVDQRKIDIPNRENKSMVIQWLYEEEFDFEFLVTTIGDVLRFFDENRRMGNKITRKFRRTIAKVLNNLDYTNKLEDYYRDREQWIFIFDLLHIGDYFKTYKTLEKEVKLIKYGKKPEFFNKTLEDLKANKDLDGMIKALTNRPGEFIRNFTFMLRITKNISEVYTLLDVVYTMRDKITQKALIELINGLKTYDAEYRLFKPKGGKLYSTDNCKEHIYSDTIDLCVNRLEKILQIKITDGSMYDTIYVAKELKNIPLPLVIRDQSESNLSLPRYSRVKLDENTKVIRFFTHWNNGTIGHLDIDLSAKLLTPSYAVKDNVYYGTIDSSYRNYDIRHSGDMRRDNSAEYIDVDIEKVRQHGVRYIVSMINIFDGIDDFKSIKECFGGVMELSEINEDKYVDISKVRIKSEINTKSNACVPFIIDTVKREVIWVDRIAHEITSGGCNVEDIHYGYTNTMLAVEYAEKSLSVFDYFKIFANANSFSAVYIDDEDIPNIPEERLRNSLTVGLFNGDVQATKQSQLIEYLK